MLAQKQFKHGADGVESIKCTFIQTTSGINWTHEDPSSGRRRMDSEFPYGFSGLQAGPSQPSWDEMNDASQELKRRLQYQKWWFSISIMVDYQMVSDQSTLAWSQTANLYHCWKTHVRKCSEWRAITQWMGPGHIPPKKECCTSGRSTQAQKKYVLICFCYVLLVSLLHHFSCGHPSKHKKTVLERLSGKDTPSMTGFEALDANMSSEKGSYFSAEHAKDEKIVPVFPT